ncbi:DUF262 domain-containing protein [Pseudomonas haemolytica]|uniref:DUF262 domain-containing protein n=1 Tax=Pseudomonas haemolytica TaxID=2600065 RepID=A0A646NYR2_9PSED|nr:DUF262 domain-containing protein [Pseudomonas haemolytica]MRJ21331.1 DUF262 domain-containing protein [Pseudomonas haemolytica]
MSKDLISEVSSQRHEVVVESYTQMWSELLNQYKVNDVEIDPQYQRGFRWSLEQQTRYIESLLLNIPTPPIFLAEKPDGKFEVIDGLQRFSTVVKFFSGEIFQGEKPEVKGVKLDQNNIRIPTILSHAPILTGLSKLTRETMPETLLRTLRYARIQVILLKKESSQLAKYNVFTRLNRSGTTLSNQEIRNCSARLSGSGFADELMTLAEEPAIVNSLNLSSKDRVSMGVQECILRLIAFGNFTPATTKLEDFLDEVMYSISVGDFDFSKKEKNKVVDTFRVVVKAFPNGEAFKFRKNDKFSGAFSPNLFDIVAVGIYLNISRCKKMRPEELRDLVIDLHDQDDAIKLTGAGSNARLKMIGRAEFGRDWFSKG